VINIRKTEVASVARQEQLTGLLKKCKPKYEEVTIRPMEYVEYLKGKIEVPIKILSFGPTAKDKVEI
jgi:hypothetical protein